MTEEFALAVGGLYTLPILGLFLPALDQVYHLNFR
jgi:hypothetical protein